jgi:hypothetical protein
MPCGARLTIARVYQFPHRARSWVRQQIDQSRCPEMDLNHRRARLQRAALPTELSGRTEAGADQRNRTAISARAAHGTSNIPGPPGAQRRSRTATGLTGAFTARWARHMPGVCAKRKAVAPNGSHGRPAAIGAAAGHIFTARARHPSRDSPATSHAENSAGTVFGRRSDRAASARTACAMA